MKTLFKIAWRNIWRSKLRSSVVIAAITVGMIGGLFSSAWMKGIAMQRVVNAFNIEIPHIQIQESSFADNRDLKALIFNGEKLESQIRENELVEGVNKKLIVSAMAATASKNAGVNIFGIDPESHNSMYKMSPQIIEDGGTFFNDDFKNSVVVSKYLADKLKLRLKSKLIVTFQDYNGNISGAVFKVRGIFQTDNTPWDKSNVFVRESYLRENLKLPKDTYHQIDVKVDDYLSSSRVKDVLKEGLSEYRIESWDEFSPMISIINSYMNYMMYVFLGIILLALGFAIVNTMLMVILERTKELGVLMAIGLNKKKLFLVIMLETTMLTLVGGIIGEILSFLLINHFSTAGIDLSIYADGLKAVGYSPITYPFLESGSYIEVSIMVMVTGVLASIYPALKALKLNPSESIRSI